MTQETRAGISASMHSRSVGNIVVRSISDGLLPVALSVVTGLPVGEVERLTGVSEADSAHLPVNVFVLSVDGKHALIDAGTGPSISPSTGKLFERLVEIGLTPGDISFILMTHLHPDHVGGLVDCEGCAIYENADIHVSTEEAAFWLGCPHANVSERSARNAAFARRALAPYRERLRLIGAGECLPGVNAVPLPGHTPGHVGWMVASAGAQLLIWGDVVHFAVLQAAHPDASLLFDVDPAQARATRKSILARAAREKLSIAGAHVGYPGFAAVRRKSGAYGLEPLRALASRGGVL